MAFTIRRAVRTRGWHVIFTAALLVLFAFVLYEDRSRLQSSLLVLSHVSLLAVGFIVSLVLLTFATAAAMYTLLALRPLQFGRTLMVELAAAAVNRLLPAGLGGLGLHGMYLHKQKHSLAEATAVVSTNNLLGMLGHMLILLTIFVFWPHQAALPRLHLSPSVIESAGLVGTVLLLSMVLLPAVRKKLQRFTHNLLQSLRRYRQAPYRLLAALGLSLGLTITYASILYVSAQATGAALPAAAIFVTLTIGVLLGTATPTPGGLVGVEAGLYAGFVSYRVAPPTALAAVLLFRLATYWLPLVPGALALLIARQKRFI